MKQTGFHLSTLVLTVLLGGCTTPTQKSLLAEEAICEPIGHKGWERDICALNITNSSPYHETTRVYIVSENSIQEVESLGGGFGIHEMLASPSKRYLAIVENAGEGHPELSICSIEAAEKGDELPCFAGFDPYPGGVFDLEWQRETLFFTSDANDPMSLEDEEESYWRYALDAESGKLEKMDEAVPIE